jgi:hypothetical protein
MGCVNDVEHIRTPSFGVSVACRGFGVYIVFVRGAVCRMAMVDGSGNSGGGSVPEKGKVACCFGRGGVVRGDSSGIEMFFAACIMGQCDLSRYAFLPVADAPVAH